MKTTADLIGWKKISFTSNTDPNKASLFEVVEVRHNFHGDPLWLEMADGAIFPWINVLWIRDAPNPYAGENPTGEN